MGGEILMLFHALYTLRFKSLFLSYSCPPIFEIFTYSCRPPISTCTCLPLFWIHLAEVAPITLSSSHSDHLGTLPPIWLVLSMPCLFMVSYHFNWTILTFTKTFTFFSFYRRPTARSCCPATKRGFLIAEDVLPHSFRFNHLPQGGLHIFSSVTSLPLHLAGKKLRSL